MKFRDIEITDKSRVDKFTKYSECMTCQLSFANLFCLRQKYNTKVLIDEDRMIIKQDKRDIFKYESFGMPLCKNNIKNTIEDLLTYVHSNNKKLMFFGITEDDRFIRK